MSDTSDASAEPPVLTRIENGVGRITLNRPKVLHALNTEMCEEIIRALLAWKDESAVQAVMIDHTGERGFCAGGDIRMLAESGAGDGVAARRFFLSEYRMNHLLFVYPKPTVVFMDGIVMGGGVGISAPAKVRIATERTTYAMPETGIGLFPDVGGGWFLPRMPGQSGIWMALTGARLKAADCLALGLATHVVESGRIEALKAAVLGDAEAVFGAPELFAQSPGAAPIQPHRSDIDRLFAFDTMEEIFAALEADGGEWAHAQLAILKSKSPQSLKVSLRQMRTGAKLTSFADNMAMEYALAVRVVRTHDFQDGVRAVIVDKDNAPKWSPADLAGVTDADLDQMFAPLPPEEAWTPVV
jgi:enoyl-CoA hydratase